MLCLAILGRNVDQQVVKSVPPKSKEDNAMTDRWKDAGPGGDIFDALMSVDGGEKRTIQDTRTGEYREVYRGPGQTTGEAIEKGQFTSDDSHRDDDKGCFLTSACIHARGLPDSCRELDVLRHFRDEYVAKLPGGESEIQAYYWLAPRIVQKIDNSPDRATWYEFIYHEIVSRCVDLISTGSSQEAFDLYKRQTHSLAARL